MNTLQPLLLFAFVTAITPGPNNILLASSGIRFGFVRSIPHILGAIGGFALMMTLCAVGLGELVMLVPGADLLLRIAGSSYLLYMAWQLRHMDVTEENEAGAKPLSFSAAALFQFTNVKAWIVGITGAAVFLPSLESMWLCILLFSLVDLPCLGVWAAAGAVLRRYLRQKGWCRLFCMVMIAATLYAAVSMWMP